MTASSDSASAAPIVRAVHVPCSQQRAFHIFVNDMAKWWPLTTHSVFESDSESVEFTNGVIVERSVTGNTCVWGKIQRWDEPQAIEFSWYPGREADEATHVVIVFEPDPDGTRVVLTHSGWDTLARDATPRRDRYASPNGWNATLTRFVTFATAAGS